MSPATGPADDDDPVIAEYDVYITPELLEQTFLLQYPNRASDQPYNSKSRSEPLGMRMKPQAGFVEIDVPMQVHSNYDKVKGVSWGESLRKAADQGQNAFGVASGFERAPPPRDAIHGRGGGRTTSTNVEEEDSEDDLQELLNKFADANEKGHVLNKQTLGGQLLPDERGKPVYMLGAFRGTELHLTKLTGIVQMRTQFHHIDATTHLEQAARRREREAAEPPKSSEPRAVQLTAKSADGEGADNTSHKSFLRASQEEQWAKLRFYDEDTDEAFEAYHHNLFVQDTGNAQRLVSSMSNEQYLEYISAPRHDPSGQTKKKPLTRKQRRAIELSDDSEDPEQLDEPASLTDIENADDGLEQVSHA